MATKKPAKSKARTPKPAKAKTVAHKKSIAGPARKVARKSPVKHTAKATRAPSSRSDSEYMKYSGKFTVRLPKSLHQALVDRAEKEGVSLNLFVTNALSRTVAISGKGKR